MFNLFKDVLGLVEDVITLPTDLLGLTNFSSKKQAREYVETQYAIGNINHQQYIALMKMIDNSKTLNI